MHTGYRIVIRGTQPGFTAEQVGDALSPRLKHAPDELARVLRSGQVINLTVRELDLQAARALQSSINKSGCTSTLESLAPPLPPAPVGPKVFSAQDFRPFTGGKAHLLLNAPAAWRNASDDEYLRIVHAGGGSTFTASCNPDPGVDLAVWAELRLGSISNALPFLRPYLPPMRLATEAGPAIVAEFRGRKPGDTEDTHQLVLCLCPPEGAISLNITATVAGFDRHQALYQWLLRTQLHRYTPTGNDPADMPGADHPQAQFEIGWRFAAAEDFSSAAHWFGQAAEQGHAEAQFYLGGFYTHGRGVARDEVQAFQWCRRAAEQGWQKAQEALARMYFQGVGVEADQDQAAYWLQLANAARPPASRD